MHLKQHQMTCPTPECSFTCYCLPDFDADAGDEVGVGDDVRCQTLRSQLNIFTSQWTRLRRRHQNLDHKFHLSLSLSLSLSLIHSLPLFFLLLFPSLPIAFSISYHSPTNAPTISICAYLSLSHVTHRQNSLRGDLAVEGGVGLRNSIPFQQKASSFPYEDKPDRLSAKEASFLLNGEEILRLSPPSSKELCAISLSLSCMIVLAFLSLSLSHL